MRTAEARSVVRELMAYPMQSTPMHQDSGHKGRPPALLYQYEHALGEWFEIEGDIVRYCPLTSAAACLPPARPHRRSGIRESSET